MTAIKRSVKIGKDLSIFLGQIFRYLAVVAWEFKGIVLLRAVAFYLIGLGLFKEDASFLKALDVSFTFQVLILMKFTDEKINLTKQRPSLQRVFNYYGLLAIYVLLKMVYLNS